MLKNHIKIAWRNLLNNGLFSTLNLLGLSVGVAIFLYLFLFTKQELSFDKYYKNAESVYRVGQTATFGEEVSEWASVPNIVGPKMTEEIPEIKAFTRLLYHSFGETAFVNSEQDKYAETKVYWSDAGLFDIFDVPLVYGNPKTALDAPNKIMLSKSTAAKYFGNENPVGKPLTVDSDYKVTVAGVYEDFPENSTFDAELIGSFSTIKWASDNLHWSNASYETYFLLEPNVIASKVQSKINAVLDENVEKENQWFRFWLQPLTDIHLYSTHIVYASTTRLGDIQQVNILVALALGILLIACINYMNLATAQSQKRRKEVGISKAVGASQGSLIGRFYVEAFLMVFAAVLIGVAFLFLGMPVLNFIAEKNISFNALFDWQLAAGITTAVIGLAFIAGSYPALLLSSFSPLSLFGRRDNSAISATWIRKGLVVLQFTASIILIIGTFVFYRQLQFIQTTNLGYNAEQVVSVSVQGAESQKEINSLRDYYQSLSFVSSITEAQAYPGIGASGRTIGQYDEESEGTSIQTNSTTPDVLKTLDIKLLAGTTFTEKTSEEDTTVQLVVNKTTVDFLGMTPEEAIGKTAYNTFGYNRATIVGVTEDFHFENFHQPITAYAFHNNKSEWRRNLLVRFDGGTLTDNMKTLEAGFQKFVPNSAFEYTFLDDVVAKLYASEKQIGRIVMFFSITAILIACLGLFGLAAYTAEQRTKEIGVRKVLGASVSGLVGLLSADFIKLVLIALVIASPIAWYLLNGWLESYAFHIEMPWWIFGVAGAISVFVAFLTVSYQSIKAATVNPVKSLKTE
jgi:putative ABC transport system permease protein